jgi:hypothetical protein
MPALQEAPGSLHHGASLLAPISAARPMSVRGEFVYGKSRDQIEFFADHAG